jgi:hypothetical protein
MHTHIHTHVHTNKGNVGEQTLTPASPLRNNSPYQPQPAQPSPTNQPPPTSAIPSQPKYCLSPFSLAFLHYPALFLLNACKTEPIHSLSHTLSLTHVSPSHPRARNRAPPKRRRAPPNGGKSRENH